MTTDGAPTKADDRELPVPLVWRPVIQQVVEHLRGDQGRAVGVPGVRPVSAETSKQIQEYVADYGETLVSLPEASWETSIASWTGEGWDVLVDLWTEREGRSDLVLHLQVQERGPGYEFEVYMVYVP